MFRPVFIKLTLLFFTSWLTLPSFCQRRQAPKIEVEHFSIEQGLSDRNVTSICKDQQGFLWIGTNNGLNRFDGYGFLTYDAMPRNRHKITNSGVAYVMADMSGKLLVFLGKKSYDVLDPEQSGQAPQTGKVTRILFDESNGYRGERIIERQAANGTIFSLAMRESRSVIHRFEEKTGKFVQVFEGATWLKRGVSFLDFLPAADGTFWFAYEGNFRELSIIQTDSTGNTLLAFDHSHFSVPPSPGNAGVKLAETAPKEPSRAGGEIWLSVFNDGVYSLDAAQGIFKPHPHLPKGSFLFQNDRRGNLLAWQPFPKKPKESVWLFSADGQRSDYSWILDHQQQITSFFSDDFSVWLLAGSSDGLYKYRIRRSSFDTFLTKDLSVIPFGTSIRGMINDGFGRLLIATERDGVFEMGFNQGSPSPPPNIPIPLTRPGDRSPQLTPLDTISFARNLLMQGDSAIWIPHHNGLLKYLPGKNALHSYPIQAEPEAIALGRDGRLWIAKLYGQLLQIDPRTDLVSEYKNKDGSQPLADSRPTYLIAGRDGKTLWAGSSLSGLIKIDLQNGTSQRFTANPDDPAQLNSNYISCIYEDAGGLLWLGTLQGGLGVFDPNAPLPDGRKGRLIAFYTKENGLSHNNVAGILPTPSAPPQGGMTSFWVSTYGGLSFFDARQKTFRNYSTADGLSHNEFNRHSFFYDPRAQRCYFGGMNGVNAFFEKDLAKTESYVPLLISEINYSGTGDSIIVRQEGIRSGSTITLPPGNRFLYLRLALADYLQPGNNQFSYKIEGLDKDWNYLGTTPDFRLNQLPTGSYTLRLRGADSQGNWSKAEIELQLRVQQFWYKRWWAWLLYAGLLAAGGFYFYRFSLQRKMAEKEAHRLQELDEFKSRFFTNITHEFRTPLTVILGISEQLAVGSKQPAVDTTGGEIRFQKSKFQNQIGLIKRNGESLLRLINQILDLAKLEDKSLKINYVQGDVLPYLRYITESLHSLANAQNVLLKVESSEAKMVMDYDSERLLSVVHNLLSNAIKFTPSGGKVTLRAATDLTGFENLPSLSLTVSDTGVGISPEDLPKIFDRFYQVESAVSQVNSVANSTGGGTGIGLSLTKELVKAMGGDISVESTVGVGTTFLVHLPMTNKAAMSDRMTPSHLVTLPTENLGGNFPKGTPSEKLPPTSTSAIEGELPSILLIEDNPDVVEYLAACLGESYQLDYAYNGRAGIEKALETVPDLILSDVMMPEKDGFEVCNFLKNDERTSHIPIVLLTAKADVESRIAGLKRGADAYLAKPFHQEELMVTLANLLELRRKLQTKYLTTAFIAEPLAALSTMETPALPLDLEHEFLKKVRALVEKNISDADFEMPHLERALAMSRSQIFRKIKALTGKSPSLYIRSIRLARAKELLADKKLNVSEIAYEVGFSSPVYFSNAFLEEFGVRPSEARK